MKIIEKQKQIEYFGVTLTIGEGYDVSIATDSDGCVYWYDSRIERDDEKWSLLDAWDGRSMYLCKVDLEGLDWRESKVVVK